MKSSAVIAVAIIFFMSVGCAKKSISLTSGTGKNTGGGNTAGPGEPTVRPATGYSPSPLNFRQISSSLIAMAGISNPAQIAEIEAESEKHKAQFPKTGSLDEVTPNSMNAAFFLASKVCDFIKTGSGLPLNTINASATSNPSETVAVNTASNYYAQKFLGRDLSADELIVFLNLKRNGGFTSTATLHQMICTIIASSAESLSM